MPRSSVEDCGGPNFAAFLDMLAWSELGSGLLAASDDGYNVIVGSTAAQPILFHSYTAHPNVLQSFKTKSGVVQQSTAAGRYQCLHRYAVAYMRQLHLPDFGPDSQDKIALQQIKEQGANAALMTGQIYKAIDRCKNIWASLPGAGYDQHEQSIALLIGIYKRAGGTIAAT